MKSRRFKLAVSFLLCTAGAISGCGSAEGGTSSENSPVASAESAMRWDMSGKTKWVDGDETLANGATTVKKGDTLNLTFTATGTIALSPTGQPMRETIGQMPKWRCVVHGALAAPANLSDSISQYIPGTTMTTGGEYHWSYAFAFEKLNTIGTFVTVWSRQTPAGGAETKTLTINVVEELPPAEPDAADDGLRASGGNYAND